MTSTLVITIDADTDVVMSGSPTSPTQLGVTGYQEPAVIATSVYGAGSPYLHGATALSWHYEQTLLNFTVSPFGAASESAAEALLTALRTAVARMGFNVTTTVNGVAKVWRCDAGSVTPAGPRTWVNVGRPNVTEWNVSIPCYPVPS